MTVVEIVDAIAAGGGHVEFQPDRFRVRVHGLAEGLTDELRQAMRAAWTELMDEIERRQAEALEIAREVAKRHLAAHPTEREEAIDLACDALLPAVLDRGVDVPDIAIEELLKAPGATAGAIIGEQQ